MRALISNGAGGLIERAVDLNAASGKARFFFLLDVSFTSVNCIACRHCVKDEGFVGLD